MMKLILLKVLFFVTLCSSIAADKIRTKRANIEDYEWAEFAKGAVFNVVGLVFPPGYLIQNVIDLLTSPKSGKSVFEEIKEDVRKEVMSGVTTFYSDFIYTKLRAYNSSLDGLHKRILKNEPEKFLPKLIQLREKMMEEKEFFFPTSFENSVGFNASYIICMGPFTVMYMAVSYEIENYLKTNQRESEGIFTTNTEERLEFLKSVSMAAEKTMHLALDKRLTFLKNANYRFFRGESIAPTIIHYTQDELLCNGPYEHKPFVFAWTRFNQWVKVEISQHTYLTHLIRKKAELVIEKNVFKPINLFLQNNSLPLIPPHVDRMTDFPLTIYGTACRTDCMEHDKGYWWCGIQDDWESWEYCSPLADHLVTRYNERCFGECSLQGSAYRCKTASSWDYCSPYHQYNADDLRWPNFSPSFTIDRTKAMCDDECKKDGENYYWCNIEGSWDYCSPNTNLQMTYKGETCTSGCKSNHGDQYSTCKTQNGESWDYCSPTYYNTIKSPPIYGLVDECPSTDACRKDNVSGLINRFECQWPSGKSYLCAGPEAMKYKDENCPESCEIFQTEDGAFICSQMLCITLDYPKMLHIDGKNNNNNFVEISHFLL